MVHLTPFWQSNNPFNHSFRGAFHSGLLYVSSVNYAKRKEWSFISLPPSVQSLGTINIAAVEHKLWDAGLLPNYIVTSLISFPSALNTGLVSSIFQFSLQHMTKVIQIIMTVKLFTPCYSNLQFRIFSLLKKKCITDIMHCFSKLPWCCSVRSEWISSVIVLMLPVLADLTQMLWTLHNSSEFHAEQAWFVSSLFFKSPGRHFREALYVFLEHAVLE